MAAVSIISVNVLVRLFHPRRAKQEPGAAPPPSRPLKPAPPCQDNPSLYTNPLQFEIQYECSQSLQHGASESRPLPPPHASRRPQPDTPTHLPSLSRPVFPSSPPTL